MTKPRRAQPLPIRITHWVNVPVLTVMAMSGLQILNAYPMFGPRGEPWRWVPLGGSLQPFPSWMTAGGWLAGARHLHFALAWLLVANACVYLVYLVASGEFRRRWFWPPRDTVPAVRQQLYYVDAFWFRIASAIARVRKKPPPARKRLPPPSGLYNGLQRAAYSAAFSLGVLEVLSGLAIWKPVQLHRLAWAMGGYDAARVVHFVALLALVAFAIVHVVMVCVHWRQFPEIVTGGKPHA
ncbi:MAG TPA: cytochrome b/b6 domain-containing protein [Kofleriaceae bacterium]|nr:cytochrome b/b6 domain-containing protein [Kofleriaceae bacterium]